MKKLIGLLSVFALLGMFACNSGVNQEELTNLKDQIEAKEAAIVDLQAEIDELTVTLEECTAENVELKTPKKTTTTTTTKPAETKPATESGRRGTAEPTEQKSKTGRRG